MVPTHHYKHFILYIYNFYGRLYYLIFFLIIHFSLVIINYTLLNVIRSIFYYLPSNIYFCNKLYTYIQNINYVTYVYKRSVNSVLYCLSISVKTL
jgi:hypothetical protein